MLEGTSFRPDVLMMTFILAGIYVLFCFWKNEKTLDLSVAFLLFWLAILSLQKALLILFPMGCFWVYGFFQYHISLKKTLLALFPVCALIGLFLFGVLFLGIFKDYFELNWVLNTIMRMEYRFPVHLTMYYGIANGLAIVILWRTKDPFLKFIAFQALFLSFLWQFVVYAPF